MADHVESCSTLVAQSSAQPSDCTAEQLAATRYLDALHELVEDAAAGKRMHLLADALAGTFARVAIGCGPAATGDMLSRAGRYMTALETRNEAARELEQARREGRAPS